MSKILRELQSKKTATIADARKITDIAASEGRDLTDSEAAAYGALEAKIKTLSAAIEREMDLIAEEAQAAPVAGVMGKSFLSHAANVSTFGSGEPITPEANHGFKSFGEFAQATARAYKGQGFDRRLDFQGAATTYGSASVGGDGGYLIPQEFSNEIFDRSLVGDALLPKTSTIAVEGNNMVFPFSEATPWGNSGIQAFWSSEATAGTQTKPVINQTQLNLHKLMALIPVTDELMGDAMAIDQYISKKSAEAIRWKANEAIMNGTGAGQPHGCMASGAALTIAKESAQPTGTLYPVNLAKMLAALPSGSYGNAFWQMHADVLPYLWTLNTTNGAPIYLPSGSPGAGPLQGNPYGTLMGRPIMVSDHCQTFSSAGDVVLTDLTYYQTITKRNANVESATSIHLWFDQSVTAFRIIFRMDGKAMLSQPISPAKGTNKRSPFVLLGAR
ncbi:MAG: phage major capsid protein [Magnetococcales bacterium]|nr:phage major capsid protein [Magnetococcales bacterium]